MSDHSTRPATTPVIVGYVDSPTGDAAMAAAAGEARLRGTSLTVMHKLIGDSAPEVYGHDTRSSERHHTAVHQLRQVAHDIAPDLNRVDVQLVTGPIGKELILASHTAALVVLGVTTNHVATAAIFDTVSREVVRGAHCPVMVVPSSAGHDRPTRVVCAIDRTASSIDALRWAAHEAALRGVTMLAVEVSPAQRHGSPRPDAETLSTWVRRHTPPVPTTVLCSAQTGRVAQRLLEITNDNDGLLVVGAPPARDHRARSVTRVVTSQTRVPVVVVPAGAERQPSPSALAPRSRSSRILSSSSSVAARAGSTTASATRADCTPS